MGIPVTSIEPRRRVPELDGRSLHLERVLEDNLLDGLALNEAARRLGVRPLSEFECDEKSWNRMFWGPWLRSLLGLWYTAEEGLITVRALLKHIAAIANQRPDTPAVVAELRKLEAILSLLAERGVRWRLVEWEWRPDE